MTLLERRPRGVRLTRGRPHAGGAHRGHPRAPGGGRGGARGDRGPARRAAADGLLPHRRRDADAARDRAFRASYPEVELTLAEGEPEEIAPAPARRRVRPRAAVRVRGRRAPRGRVTRHRVAPVPQAPLPARAAGKLTAAVGRERSESFEAGRELLEDPMYLALPREHALARQARAAPGGPARRGLGTDLSVEPVRAPRRALLPRGGIRAERGLRERRLPDRAGLVAAGVGVALIPELALSVVREDIVVRALAPHPPVRQCDRGAPGCG